jgi:hypothetical protein
MLMQSFFMLTPSGRIGFIASGERGLLSLLKFYGMDF